MKQIIQSYKTGKLEIANVPVPQIFPGAIKVKVAYSVISSGTERQTIELSKKSLLGKAKTRPDLVRKVVLMAKKQGLLSTIKQIRNKLDMPVPLGYSAAGTVISIAPEVTGFVAGDHVAIAGAGYANHAEYDVVPVNLAVKLSENVPLADASFTTVASIALQAVRRAQPEIGDIVAVLGLGLIGQLVVMLLELNGCRVLAYDPNRDRALLAEKSGAARICSDSLERTAREFTSGTGVDATIICASTRSAQPVMAAGDITRQKGTVVLVGNVPMHLPREQYYQKELDFLLSTSYGPGRYDFTYEELGIDYPYGHVRWTENRNMMAIVEFMASGKLDFAHLVSHRASIEHAANAYAQLQSDKGSMAILLSYPEQDKQSANGTAAIMSVKRATQRRNKHKTKLNVGFIGCGNFSQRVLIPHFMKNKHVNLFGLVSQKGYTAFAACRKFGFAFTASTVEELLSREGLHAVVVNTRHNLHADMVTFALEKNIDVFVEKPLAINRAQLLQIVSTAKQRNAVLQTGFNRRFSPIITQLKSQLTDAPKIVVYTINAGIIPRDHWIQQPDIGGGRIIGEVCHFIDLISVLCDSLVTEVTTYAITEKTQYYGKEDNFAVLLKYQNGDIGQIVYHAIGGSMLEKERIEVNQGYVSMVVHDFRSLSIFSTRKKRRKYLAQQKGFKQEIAAFIDGTKKGTPAMSLESMINTTLTSFAIKQSIYQGTSIDVKSMETLFYTDLQTMLAKTE